MYVGLQVIDTNDIMIVVKVIVLTDEPYVYPDLQNIVCPKAYVSPLGKAKYKARALDYFRYHVSLGVYDWILHMDEESVTDGESLRRCLEFIRYVSHPARRLVDVVGKNSTETFL